MTDDEFYDIQNEWYGKWFAEGADTYRLAIKPDDMPEDAYQRFCETAIGDDAWIDTPYNCMESGIITVKYHESGTKKGPFLTTKWRQYAPYNSQIGGEKPLGCVTIAVGQLMRYYQHPAYFNWSDMPDETSNSTLSSFWRNYTENCAYPTADRAISTMRNGFSKVTDTVARKGVITPRPSIRC